MEESLDHENNIPKPGSLQSPEVIPNLSTLLQRDLLNHDIANIANDVVAKYGSESMKHANNSLNAWRRNWDVRRMHDVHEKDGGDASFGHPLNFWLLAKLFVVLHFFRHHIMTGPNRKGNEHQDSEFLAFSCASDGTVDAKIRAQIQVVNWLSRIRRRGQDADLLPAEGFMSQIISAG